MLEGIEILAQTEIIHVLPDSAAFFLIVILSAAFVASLVTTIANICDGNWECLATGFLSVLVGIVLILCIKGSIPEPTGRYEYQVTIGDNVSFTEFYQKYEVIDQNGKIWTIREKEND